MSAVSVWIHGKGYVATGQRLRYELRSYDWHSHPCSNVAIVLVRQKIAVNGLVYEMLVWVFLFPVGE